MASNNWLTLSIASGLCASLNGLFAKLVTTTLTTSIASSIANVFGISPDSKPLEYIVRGGFFFLNLLFNGIMWALFTAALAKGSSATKVSIINTTSNFILTAILGALVFAEKLPFTWWLGASMLVAGNVILGQKSEDADSAKKKDDGTGVDYTALDGEDRDNEGSEVELSSKGSEDGSESESESEGEGASGRQELKRK